MGLPFLRFNQVCFAYRTAAEPLLEDVSLHAAPGWTGIVGPNGAGKTTLLQLATGMLEPDAGHIDVPPSVGYCPQRTDTVPDALTDLVQATARRAYGIRSRLGVEDGWADRWDTLSHGERKRAQIAVALWQESDVLAVDEPTNHVDADARRVLAQALASFKGVGLLVSHDRDLLDRLCGQCLFIRPPAVVARPGGYSQGMRTEREERRAAVKDYDVKKKAYKKLKREAGRRRDAANQYDGKRSKRGLARRDHDAKAKIDAARMSGKDIVGGKLMRQLDGRLAKAGKELEDTVVEKEYAFGIWLPGSVSKRNLLLRYPAGSMRLGERKTLENPYLEIRPTDRIAVTGPNGAGKSTLLRHVLPHLNVPAGHVTYVPQEIERSRSQEFLEEVKRLPKDMLGHVMTVISRLGSRPHRLLASAVPSPGETRKMLLALGMTRSPHIIVMDEPTNHMDLPSIDCVEAALKDCPCALLLVSHDQRFLENLARIRWHISGTDDDASTYRLKVAA